MTHNKDGKIHLRVLVQLGHTIKVRAVTFLDEGQADFSYFSYLNNILPLEDHQGLLKL